MNKEIKQLVQYGIEKGLLDKADAIYCRNVLLDILHLHEYKDVEIELPACASPQPILDAMIAYAIKHGLIEDTQESRDHFDTYLMNALMPRPSEVIKTFWRLYAQDPIHASDYYYALSQASNYIRMDRIQKDQKWTTPTTYGEMEITINLSKPEKDPNDIAKAKLQPPTSYPKCLLCKENEGYAGTISHPARHNHRIIPMTLNNTAYYMQYSPYSYYPQHCIVFRGEHVPMKIDKSTFACLLDFVAQFPHYFIGSNADLPIVGGSILSHDHFQGGRHTFAMAKANMLDAFHSKLYPSITYGRVYWPLSVLRIRSCNKRDVMDFADMVLHAWKAYSDASLDIYAYSGATPHNTITPIARKKDGDYELDIALRNNRTSDAHPYGIFHPHEQLHHIKKENIGLIEVMGLAILPSRLVKELAIIEDCIVQKRALPTTLQAHALWFDHLSTTYAHLSTPALHTKIQEEIGHIFEQVLVDAGVFKQDEAGQQGFLRFIKTLEA